MTGLSKKITSLNDNNTDLHHFNNYDLSIKIKFSSWHHLHINPTFT